MLRESKDNREYRDKRYVKRRNRVYATGNKWSIQNFNELNKRY